MRRPSLRFRRPRYDFREMLTPESQSNESSGEGSGTIAIGRRGLVRGAHDARGAHQHFARASGNRQSEAEQGDRYRTIGLECNTSFITAHHRSSRSFPSWSTCSSECSLFAVPLAGGSGEADEIMPELETASNGGSGPNSALRKSVVISAGSDVSTCHLDEERSANRPRGR